MIHQNEPPIYHLWYKTIAGDASALSELFVHFYQKLYYYGMRYCADQEAVEDSIQNLFFRIWSNRRSLPKNVTIKAYLLTALRHHINDYLRKETRQTTYASAVAQHEYECCDSYENELINQETHLWSRCQLQRAITNLPPRQRQVISLRFFERTDYQEIADIMSMNLQSVRNLLHRAIKALQRELINK